MGKKRGKGREKDRGLAELGQLLGAKKQNQQRNAVDTKSLRTIN